MRFHCLGLAHTITNADYVACAFTHKIIKFAKMMRDRGHYIIHYGHEYSDLECDEHVTVVTNQVYEKCYGNNDKTKFFHFDLNDQTYKAFEKNAIEAIQQRKQKNDFLLAFWGTGHKPICDAHNDMIVVEPGIGYFETFARWKVYESYALLHSDCGMKNVQYANNDHYHAVIPGYFNPEDFEFCEEKEEYALFIGRIGSGKGIEIAIQLCEKVGITLKVAGQGDLAACFHDRKIPDHIEYIGYADITTRKKIMSKAKFGIVASMYTEPFGNVSIEFLMSGTPIITTDWGAFTENNIHGLTGYRCRTFDHFCWAAQNIHKIKPIDCYNFAMNNFRLDKVADMYEEYFSMVMNVHDGKGWYEPFPNRPSLNWLDRSGTLRTLGDIFLKHKTNKLSNTNDGHTYNVKYEELFEPMRHNKIRIFEMELGSVESDQNTNVNKPGASHKAWKEYFFHADTEVYGGGIHSSICDKINFFNVDQTDEKSLKEMFEKIGTFDIIIDAGLHTSEAAKKMFNVAWKYLRNDGYYIIEGVRKLEWSHQDLQEIWTYPKKNGKVDDNILHIFKKSCKPILFLGPGKLEMIPDFSTYDKIYMVCNNLDYVKSLNIPKGKLELFCWIDINTEKTMVEMINDGYCFHNITYKVGRIQFPNLVYMMKIDFFLKHEKSLISVIEKYNYKHKHCPSSGFMFLFCVLTEYGSAKVNVQGIDFLQCNKLYNYDDVHKMGRVEFNHDQSLEYLRYHSKNKLSNLSHDFDLENNIICQEFPGSPFQMRTLNYFPYNETNKNVAIWTEKKWAFGRIHEAIIDELKYEFNFVFYDWSNVNDNNDLWTQWEMFDLIIGNSMISVSPVKLGYIPEITESLQKRLLPVVHSELMNHDHYCEQVIFPYDAVRYCGITPSVCEIVKQASKNTYVPLLPIGVNIDHFKQFKKIQKIKKIGFIGRYLRDKHVQNMKRPEMAKEIADKCGLEIEFIHSKPHTLHSKLYENIDLLLVTSTVEGAGLMICEAAACHVPVVSTKVGYAKILKNIKTFETVDEAVAIIESIKNDPSEYIDKLSFEVRTEWNWSKLAHEYWKPVMERTVHNTILQENARKSDENKLTTLLEKKFLDFIEIGTSDFDTEIQKKNSKIGLSIDPLQFYLDRLPEKYGCLKLNNAVSDYNGDISISYIPLNLIQKYNLPDWIKCCNRVNGYHDQVSQYLHKQGLDIHNLANMDRITCKTLHCIMKAHGIDGVYFLKIDTEGHDCVILKHFFENMTDTNHLPHRIMFESNELTQGNNIESIIKTAEDIGYDLIVRTDHDTIMKLNLQKLKSKSKFSESICKYYIEGQPENYDVNSLPHDNTLEAAKKYCTENKYSGVTYENEKYLVRNGKYIQYINQESIKSWIFI